MSPGFPFRLILKSIVVTVLLFGPPAKAINPVSIETSEEEAVENVRAILRMNTAPCKIDRIRTVAAVRTRTGWRVTAKLVMSVSGKPLNETAIWVVAFGDGEAVPANQLTSEISNGCP